MIFFLLISCRSVSKEDHCDLNTDSGVVFSDVDEDLDGYGKSVDCDDFSWISIDFVQSSLF